MSRITEGERIRRDMMFQQGMLWCSKCKQFYPVKNFRKYGRPDRDTESSYGYFLHCRHCERAGHRTRKDSANKRMNERNTELKRKWAELAGGKCQRCGYSEFQSALDFHHVYPVTKKYLPSVIIFRNDTKKTWEELDKCCLLCSICHRAYKAREWRAEFIKRDGLGWTVGDPLPLDDDRYETKRPPKHQQAIMPLFTYQQRDLQLRLFEGETSYVV